jgi:hypothetical protein
MTREQINGKIRGYLHLYIGCEGESLISYGFGEDADKWVYCTLIGINSRRNVVIVKCRDIYGNEWEDFREIPFIRFRLKLRPLESMTEEERLKFAELKDIHWEGKLLTVQSMGALTHYLLSKHFDIFGLIKDNLALDATKQNKL